jgi:hypothetical protein
MSGSVSDCILHTVICILQRIYTLYNFHSYFVEQCYNLVILLGKILVFCRPEIKFLNSIMIIIIRFSYSTKSCSLLIKVIIQETVLCNSALLKFKAKMYHVEIVPLVFMYVNA